MRKNSKLVPGKVEPLRPGLAKLQSHFKAWKAAKPEDLLPGFKDSPINRTVWAKELDIFFRELKENYNSRMKPHELGPVFDTADKSDPYVKELIANGVKDLVTSCRSHMTRRAEHYGIPISYIQLRQKTKLILLGSEED